MEKRRFTEKHLDELKPPPKGRITIGDAALPGLLLRVTSNGAKSFCIVYKRGTRLRRYTIGAYPKIDLSAARELARRALIDVAGGADPAGAKRAAALAPAGETVETAFARYLARQVKPNLAAGFAAETERIFRRDILPRWAKRPLAEITKGDVIALVDRKAESAATQANRVLARARTFFNWAVAKDILKVNPADGVEPPTDEKARDRVLSDEEIRLFWRGCDALGWPFGPLHQLLLLTAQRREEVAGMRWSEVALKERLWTLPPERAKNGKGHLVPLSDGALMILEALPRMDSKAGLIFTTNGRTSVSGFSRAKERLDEFMLKAKREASGEAPDEIELKPWIIHDLRRTATTGIAKLKFPPHVVDKILNHTSGTIRGVAAIYNRHEYLDERRAALAAWGRHVERLVGPASDERDNVIPLTGSAREG